jgi:hypothetical protein
MKPNKPNNGNNDTYLEILGDVELQSFTATPPTIGPFGSSVLRWVVTGPAKGFTVKLDGATVNRSASRTVEPRVTTPYRLNAHAGPYDESLAILSVIVDTSTCSVVDSSFPDPRGELLNLVKNLVLNSDSSLYIPERAILGPFGEMTFVPLQPSLSFQPGRMRIVLHLSKHVPAPDPAIDVTIECGLLVDVNDGSITTWDPTITGTVSEPWYVDLLPIYGLIVSLKAGSAQDSIPLQFQPVVDVIPDLVSLIYPIDLDKQRYQAVTIPGDPADPPIRLIACPKTAGAAPGARADESGGPSGDRPVVRRGGPDVR